MVVQRRLRSPVSHFRSTPATRRCANADRARRRGAARPAWSPLGRPAARQTGDNSGLDWAVGQPARPTGTRPPRPDTSSRRMAGRSPSCRVVLGCGAPCPAVVCCFVPYHNALCWPVSCYVVLQLQSVVVRQSVFQCCVISCRTMLCRILDRVALCRVVLNPLRTRRAVPCDEPCPVVPCPVW